MSAKKKSDVGAVQAGNFQDVPKETEDKVPKKRGASSKKLHVEIARGNWKRLDAFVEAYNRDPERVTPKIKPVNVVNDAIAAYLGADKRGR